MSVVPPSIRSIRVYRCIQGLSLNRPFVLLISFPLSSSLLLLLLLFSCSLIPGSRSICALLQSNSRLGPPSFLWNTSATLTRLCDSKPTKKIHPSTQLPSKPTSKEATTPPRCPPVTLSTPPSKYLYCTTERPCTAKCHHQKPHRNPLIVTSLGPPTGCFD